METKHFALIAVGVVVVLVTIGVVLNLRARRDSRPKPITTDNVTLTVWRLFDSEEPLRPIIDEYRAENPNVTIVYEKKNPADYEALFTNAIAGGKGPDILSLPNEWLVKHRDKLVPMPAEMMTVEQFRDTYARVVVEEVVAEDKIYGLPLYADSLALYVNPVIFNDTLNRLREANPTATLDEERRLLSDPPATWDDVVAVVKLVTQKRGTDVTLSGLAMGTAETTQNAPAILQALMLQNGAEMTNATRTEAAFHLPDTKRTGEAFYPGTQALDFFTSFARPNTTVYSWNDRMGSSLDAFMNGKAAMMINFQYVQQDLRQRAPTLSFEVGPLPQIKGTTEPVNVASYMVETVTKDADRPEVAWHFLKYLAERGGSKYRSATRRTSPRRIDLEGNQDPFAIGIRSSRSIYKPDAPKYDGYFREMIASVVNLRQPPQAAIEVAAGKVTKLLQGQE